MMKIAYEHELRNLQSWINNVNMGLASVGTVATEFYFRHYLYKCPYPLIRLHEQFSNANYISFSYTPFHLLPNIQDHLPLRIPI